MNSVARIILQQLGGQRFAVMTGATDFVSSDGALKFRLPSNLTKERATHMVVRLAPSDTYTLELLRWNGQKLEFKMIKSVSDVHAENLREVFTDLTGLATSL